MTAARLRLVQRPSLLNRALVRMFFKYLEVQGTYNEAISVAIFPFSAPAVELTRLHLGHKYTYGLVITTLDF